MTTVLITGAAGYVGSRLVAQLADSTSIEPRALVRRRVSHLPEKIQFIADLSGPKGPVSAAFDGVDVVIHLAGANEVVARQEPELALTETISAAYRAGHYAEEAGVSRVVFVSTVHVYGSAMVEDAVLTEDTLPSPRSIYATARLTSEHLLWATTGASTEMVVLRLTNSLGAPLDPSVDRWSLVANDLCRQAALTGQLKLRSHGYQWRDFISLTDVCRVLEAGTLGSIAPGTYNLGSGEPMTIRGLAELVQEAYESITGVRPPLLAPEAPQQVSRPYRVAIDRLGACDLSPTSTVRSAVEETIRFCIDHKERL